MKIICHDTILWFGKHKGKLAGSVDPAYMKWVDDNVDDVDVMPDLLPEDTYDLPSCGVTTSHD